jgi:hypothetical protein
MDLRRLAPRDLRRLVGEMWTDQRCDAVAPAVLDEAIRVGRKSCDGAVILAYLRHLPTDHPAFDRLAAAAALAADRREWLWAERGRRWQLWNPADGPAKLGAALLDHIEPIAILREAGLDGELSESAFVADALEHACERVGTADGDDAEALGQRLIALFEQLNVGALDAMLVYALLNPWLDRNPSEAYRDTIARLLGARIGDPRTSEPRWAALLEDLRECMPGIDAEEMLAVLRRWLVHTTVREFFKIVGRATDDPVQWAAREKFWLGYLDANLITDAWFAFGQRAEALARTFDEQSSVDYGSIVGSGADPSHSSLIVTIGDLRIAEWSHNGAARFWSVSDRQAPALYKSQYFGVALRAMNGGSGFEYIAHQGRWQVKFARKIFRGTGITHPFYKDGWDG